MRCPEEDGADSLELEFQMNVNVSSTLSPSTAHWGAVWALSLTVVCLVTAELLPISLLTPMAADLNVSEGVAGQAVSAASVVAMLASLFTATATRKFDRRNVLMMLTAFFIVSNVLVGTASSYTALLIGRVILGAAIGGFWSMSAAVSLRLVPDAAVPRALSIILGGVSVALVVAGPVGSFLGGILGWRLVFLLTASVGVLALIWQFLALPSIPSRGKSNFKALFGLLGKPQIALGILGTTLVNGGHFAFFTYLRPLLETVTRVDLQGVSAILFGFGIANIVGTAMSGGMVKRSLVVTLASAPAGMTVVAFGLCYFGGVAPIAAALVAVWGFAFGLVPVAWMTWLTRTVPDETESAGGLQVAAIQLSITIGAGLGGLLLDTRGPLSVVAGAGLALFMAAFIVIFGLRNREQAVADD
jgi:predicted MFS family arabinose efflux permease